MSPSSPRRPQSSSSPPTARQRRVLDFVASFLAAHGYPPTHAEIADGLGYASPNAAREHVRLLSKKGLLAVTPGVSRGLCVVAESEPRRSDSAPEPGLPLIGRVAAGAPILAAEHVERRVAIDPAVFRPRADYLLRVQGDSMIDAGILSGDLVAVRRASRPEPGQIAVVRLDDEVTVKTWRPTGARVVLEPANAAYRPLTVDPRRTALTVEGVVVGVLRLGAAP